MEKEPTLFDVSGTTEQSGASTDPKDRPIWERVYEQLELCEQLRDETGEYTVLPTAELLPRIEQYFNTHRRAVEKALAPLPNDVQRAVFYDYVISLIGNYDYTATVEQMEQALRIIPPSKAYLIDRYGLYLGVLWNYSQTLEIKDEYTRKMKGAQTGAEKNEYLVTARNVYTSNEYRAVRYLFRHGIANPDDFGGCDFATAQDFLWFSADWANVGDYTTLYLFARAIYNATPEELEAITPPPLFAFNQVKATAYAEQAAKETEADLDDIAVTFADIIEAEKKEREQAEAEKNRKLALYPIPLNIGSRPVNIAADGDVTKQFPVQRFIDDFISKYPAFTDDTGKPLITPIYVQKVFEGINMIAGTGRMNPKNGVYSYLTNIEDFAKLVGYGDANAKEKKALLGCLRMFHGLYVVVDRPLRKVKDINGRLRTTGGLTAINVLQLQEFGLQSGELKINISTEALKGEPTMITQGDFLKLRKRSKGVAQSRFNAQILSKGHKAEDELVFECFGYDEKTRDYIRKHQAEDRRKVEQWFKEYTAEGLLTYTKKKNQNGVCVYSWKRRELEQEDGTADE